MRQGLVIGWFVVAASGLVSAQAVGPRPVPADVPAIVVGSSYAGADAAELVAWALEVDGVEVARPAVSGFVAGPFAFAAVALPVGIHAIRAGACNAFGCSWSAPVAVLAGRGPAGVPGAVSITVIVQVTIP